MRTTITPHEDIVAKLREDMRRTGRLLKEAANENLRAGLASGKNADPKKFSVRARDMGPGPASSFTSASELIESLEGPTHR